MVIYIGNFPQETSEKDLQKAFKPFGDIKSATIIKDKISDRVLGFGFVDMPSKKAGAAAIEALHGAKLKGRTIIVAETKERIDRRKKK